MSYYNNRYNSRYGGGGYSRSYGNYRNYQGREGFSRNGFKKKSGAKEVQGVTRDGKKFWGISAWFFRKSTGLVVINAFENGKSTHFATEKGREGVSLMFEVFYKNTGVKRLEVATYFYDTGKAFLQNLGIIVSTKASNGGYCGYLSQK